MTSFSETPTTLILQMTTAEDSVLKIRRLPEGLQESEIALLELMAEKGDSLYEIGMAMAILAARETGNMKALTTIIGTPHILAQFLLAEPWYMVEMYELPMYPKSMQSAVDRNKPSLGMLAQTPLHGMKTSDETWYKGVAAAQSVFDEAPKEVQKALTQAMLRVSEILRLQKRKHASTSKTEAPQD